MSDTPTVLVADDQPDVIAALRLLLRTAGFDPEGAASVEDVRTQLAARDFDAVLMDLNYARDTTSGQEGLDLLERIRAMDSTLPVVLMTAWGSIELAVEAMRRGARDFVQKPWDNAHLLATLPLDEARSVVSTLPSVDANLGLIDALRRHGYHGPITVAVQSDWESHAETLRGARLDASEEAESRLLTVFAPARNRHLWSARSGVAKASCKHEG